MNRVAVYLPLADIFSKFGSGGLHIDVEVENHLGKELVLGLRRAGYDFDFLTLVTKTNWCGQLDIAEKAQHLSVSGLVSTNGDCFVETKDGTVHPFSVQQIPEAIRLERSWTRPAHSQETGKGRVLDSAEEVLQVHCSARPPASEWKVALPLSNF